MPCSRVRGRWLAPATALLPVVVAAAVGRALPDPGAAAPTLFLGAIAGGVLALLALASPGPTATRVALSSVLFVPLLTRPLDDPSPWAIAFALLAVGVVAVTPSVRAPSVQGLALRTIAWASAAQWTLHADRLWLGPRNPSSFAILVGAPVVAGLAITALLRHRTRLGLVTALLGLAAGPGWTVATIAALLAAAWVARTAARRGVAGLEPVAALVVALPAGLTAPPWLALALLGIGATAASTAPAAARPVARRLRSALSSAALGAVAAAALLALGAGALPWGFERPLTRVVGAAAFHAGRHPVLLLQGRSLPLDVEPLRFELSAPTRVESLSVDSFLLDGAALECGRPVAEVTLVRGDRALWTAPLAAGHDTGDWAAERPDVRARSLCEAPRPLQRWPAPGARFFSRRYRTTWTVDATELASSLVVRPLTTETGGRLVLTRVAVGW